ncbi:MAG: DUF3363 domain-containing protein [Bdellovibrionales bacterium]|nr:DUF3363 domain-containing protein [Bdellovibrionales bacterium]
MRDRRFSRKDQIRLGKVKTARAKARNFSSGYTQASMSVYRRWQNVTVKIRTLYADSEGAFARHGKYIDRDCVSYAGCFNSTENEVPVAERLDAWQEAGDDRMHKLVISPEFGGSIDLREHARNLLGQIETDLNTKLDWYGAIHEDTNHTHLHIVIRSVDSKGNDLELEGYLGKNARIKSQVLVTQELGFQDAQEVLSRQKENLRALRLTELDRQLIRKAGESGIFEIRSYDAPSADQRLQIEHQALRLAFLAGHGFVKKIASQSWQLPRDLREQLYRLSFQQELIRNQVQGYEFLEKLRKGGVARKRLEVGEKLVGRIIGMDIDDPFTKRKFLLLEGSDGQTYHLNQPKKLNDLGVSVGDVVCFEKRTFVQQEADKKEAETRLFTSVRHLRNWQTSWELEEDAARSINIKKKAVGLVGFAKIWAEAKEVRSKELQGQTLDEDTYYQAIGVRYESWIPRESYPSFLVGEVVARSDESFILKDIRGGVLQGVALSDVGISSAPSEGDRVVVEAKPMPNLNISRTDLRIVDLLQSRGVISEENLDKDEKRYVIPRAKTWVRWEVLERSGADFVISDKYKEDTYSLLSVMESRINLVRAQITEQIEKQPAWFRPLKEENVVLASTKFGLLDKVLAKVQGNIGKPNEEDWVYRTLNFRKHFWESKGVKVNDSFERNALKFGLKTREITKLKAGEHVVGRVLEVSKEPSLITLETIDGEIGHFDLREIANSKELSQDTVLELHGRDSGIEVVILDDWKHSQAFIEQSQAPEVIKPSFIFEQYSFARLWHEALERQFTKDPSTKGMSSNKEVEYGR